MKMLSNIASRIRFDHVENDEIRNPSSQILITYNLKNSNENRMVQSSDHNETRQVSKKDLEEAEWRW